MSGSGIRRFRDLGAYVGFLQGLLGFLIRSVSTRFWDVVQVLTSPSVVSRWEGGFNALTKA